MSRVKRVIAFGLAGTLAIGAASELRAAPVLTNATATGAAALSAVTDVRWGGWRRHGWYWGGYAGYWGSRSSTCWDRGRRIVCPGYPPGN